MARVTQTTKDITSCVQLIKLSFRLIPVKTVSSAYLSMRQLLCVALQSDVYNEKKKTEDDRTVSWGAPVLVIITSDNVEGLDLTYCGLEVR